MSAVAATDGHVIGTLHALTSVPGGRKHVPGDGRAQTHARHMAGISMRTGSGPNLAAVKAAQLERIVGRSACP